MNLIQLEASKPVQIITILKVQLQVRSIIDISDNNEKGHLKETFITSFTPGTKVALSSKLMKWWTNLEYFISNPAWNNVTILINILNKGTQTKLVHRPHYAKNQNWRLTGEKWKLVWELCLLMDKSDSKGWREKQVLTRLKEARSLQYYLGLFPVIRQ